MVTRAFSGTQGSLFSKQTIVDNKPTGKAQKHMTDGDVQGQKDFLRMREGAMLCAPDSFG